MPRSRLDAAHRYVGWLRRRTAWIYGAAAAALALSIYLIAFPLPLYADFAALLPPRGGRAEVHDDRVAGAGVGVAPARQRGRLAGDLERVGRQAQRRERHGAVAAGVDRDLEPLLDQRAGAVQRDARVDGAIVDRGAAAAEAAGRDEHRRAGHEHAAHDHQLYCTV